MRRRILVGLALLSVVGAAGQSSRRQAQELRQALRQTVDDIEELWQEELVVLKEKKKVVMTLPPRNVYHGWTWPSRASVQTNIDVAEEFFPEKVEEMREQVEEYTDLELPGLAKTIRGNRRSARRSLKVEQKQLEILRKAAAAYREKKAAQEEAAKKRPPKPAPKSVEEIRAELAKRIKEVEALEDLWSRTLQAVQAAHSDKWEKRWAGDKVTMSRLGRSRAQKRRWNSLERAKDKRAMLLGLEKSLKSKKVQLAAEIEKARKKVKALGGSFPTE